MKRLLLLLVGLALVAAAAFWWTKNYRRTVRMVPRAPRALIADPWLPARRMLASRGIRVQGEKSLSAILGRLRPNETLLLGGIDGELSLDQARRIADWVRAGGRLVASVEWQERTEARWCLLEELGVAVEGAQDNRCRAPLRKTIPAGWHGAKPGSRASRRDSSVLPPSQGDAREEPGSERVGAHDQARESRADTPGRNSGVAANAVAEFLDAPSRVRIVTLPDGAALQIEPYDVRILRWIPRDRPVEWIDPGGHLVLARVGAGSIAIVSDESIFRGQHLRQRDHAELLLRLVDPDGKRPSAWIARIGSLPTWYGWLWQRAWPALLALLLLAALGMRRAAARFGPLDHADDDERKGILEHAAAAGQWLWTLPEGPDILASRLRATTLSAVRARRPELSGLDAAGLARALSAEGRASERAIARALDTTSPGDPPGFLRNARTLWIIRRTT